MDSPTRLRQLQFGLALIGVAFLTLFFILAPAKVRTQYRKMVAELFKEIAEKIKELEKEGI